MPKMPLTILVKHPMIRSLKVVWHELVEQMLDELKEWAAPKSPLAKWNDGKTGITHTFSERLDKNQINGDTFSVPVRLRRGERCKSHRPKLSQGSALLLFAMAQAIGMYVQCIRFRKQIRLLLVEPIQRALGPSIKTFKIVVIDALDECTNLGTVDTGHRWIGTRCASQIHRCKS